ncbi:hypothetical protein [uncultured Ruegeria sp.]|uniref:hypothetical protein n=1 Tax=uncultured Ruegeria sp. TaxID=259304 RepID=UPI00260E3126|nr:hypothetical protein [uncultured Ruegeria sp.]
MQHLYRLINGRNAPSNHALSVALALVAGAVTTQDPAYASYTRIALTIWRNLRCTGCRIAGRANRVGKSETTNKSELPIIKNLNGCWFEVPKIIFVVPFSSNDQQVE